MSNPNELEERLVRFAAEICRSSGRLRHDQAARHIASQILRCGTSAAANYGEARAGESRRDFKHKLRICLKELRETLVWLKIIDRLQLLPRRYIGLLLAEANELVAIFVASVRTTEGRR
jgi:four helix bundle protein